jgi:hypothetical protein
MLEALLTARVGQHLKANFLQLLQQTVGSYDYFLELPVASRKLVISYGLL